MNTICALNIVTSSKDYCMERIILQRRNLTNTTLTRWSRSTPIISHVNSMCLWCCAVCCAQLCPTLCNTMDCSPPGSSVHGIFQARILECIAISSSRGSSRPRDQTRISFIGRQILYRWATWEAMYLWCDMIKAELHFFGLPSQNIQLQSNHEEKYQKDPSRGKFYKLPE